MKRQKQIEDIERAVFASKRVPVAVTPTDGWQRKVMAQVRQAACPVAEMIEFPVWRIAWLTAAAAMLVLCFGVWFIQQNLMMDSMTVDVAGGLAQVVSHL